MPRLIIQEKSTVLGTYFLRLSVAPGFILLFFIETTIDRYCMRFQKTLLSELQSKLILVNSLFSKINSKKVVS
jgi:hypothetical protein